MPEISFEVTTLNTNSQIVVRNDAAQRLQSLLVKYRQVNRRIDELLGPNSDSQELHEAILECRATEERIAVLLDLFAEVRGKEP